MGKTQSRDGTSIAFERLGDGPPVVVVGGATCDRAMTRPLAEQLARHFAVINYDRRGRGDSDDTAPYAVEREIEDIAAVIDEAGGSAFVYGHSSGAGLALPMLGMWVARCASAWAKNKCKNLAHDPRCVIAVGSRDLDLVVEGEAAKVGDSAGLHLVAEAYAAKYGWRRPRACPLTGSTK